MCFRGFGAVGGQRRRACPSLPTSPAATSAPGRSYGEHPDTLNMSSAGNACGDERSGKLARTPAIPGTRCVALLANVRKGKCRLREDERSNRTPPLAEIADGANTDCEVLALAPRITRLGRPPATATDRTPPPALRLPCAPRQAPLSQVPARSLLAGPCAATCPRCRAGVSPHVRALHNCCYVGRGRTRPTLPGTDACNALGDALCNARPHALALKCMQRAMAPHCGTPGHTRARK